MKPLEQRQQYVDYMTGKPVPASSFAKGGLDIFGTYVWPDVLKEHVGRQLDFDGEVWYTKSRPVEIDTRTPEQKRLQRPTELKSGISQTLITSLDRDLEAVRLTEVREELKSLSGIIEVSPEQLISAVREWEAKVYE